MQVYTKILIGMLVGIVLGLVLGPNSRLLPADTYKVTQWDRLDLRTDRERPETAIRLPAPPPGSKPTPLRLPIGDVVDEAVIDANGVAERLPVWARVRVPYVQQLALRDTDGSLRAALGDPPVDALGTPLWLRLEHTALQSGGGIVWPEAESGLGDRLVTALEPVGDAFLRLIKMVIVPLVFSSLLVGVASLGDVRKLGRVGVRTLVLYLATTAIAVTLGLVLAGIIVPGGFIDERARLLLEAQFEQAAGSRLKAAAEAPPLIETVLAVVPTNPFEALVTGDMLQIIFFALLMGIALTLLGDERGKPVVVFFDRVQEAMVVIIHIVMKLAPYGVAALLAGVVATSGFSVLKALLAYSVTVLVGLLIHGVVVYGALVKGLARLPFMGFVRAIRPALLIAFSTSSSSATLPVTMECAERNLGVSNPVASFVIPLGSTVNMDGTALYQGVAALFIAQVFQIELGFGDQVGIVLTATLASIGAAGVPGAGMVTLAMVLTTAGIPTVGVALILGVDRLLDMFRTTINVTGDLAVAAVVARAEGESLTVLSPESRTAD